MESILQKNKNLFNKICSVTSKVISTQAELNISINPYIRLSCGFDAAKLCLKWGLGGNKVSTIEDNGVVYVVWKPEATLKKYGMSNIRFDRWKNLSPEESICREMIDWFTPNGYYMRGYLDSLQNMLKGTPYTTGFFSDDNINIPYDSKVMAIKSIPSYKEVTDLLDKYTSGKVVIKLEDSVYKKLKKEREGIVPIFVYDGEKDLISFTDTPIWMHNTSSKMTNKNRLNMSLEEFAKSDRNYYKNAIRNVPYSRWLEINVVLPDGTERMALIS